MAWDSKPDLGTPAHGMRCADSLQFAPSSRFIHQPKQSAASAQVALVGRPNVGKSALFNRLVGRRVALVHDTPESHVTRDWREAAGKLADLRFTVIDTCGVEPSAPRHTIQGRGTALTGQLLSHVDLALLVIDARAGVVGPDEELAHWLTRHTSPERVLLVVNKAEGNRAQAGMAQTVADGYRLGFGDPVAVSAATGEGMADLYVALQPFVDAAVARHAAATTGAPVDGQAADAAGQEAAAAPVNALTLGQEAGADKEGHAPPAEPDESEGDQQASIRLAIAGLPNVGKSTLLNQLLGQQRVVTGPEPGLTRDPVAADLTLGNHRFHLVDTAGYIGQTKVAGYDDAGGEVAAKARAAGLTTLATSHVVLLVVDAAAALQSQKVLSGRELALVSRVVAQGRPLVVAANKMDAMPGPRERALYLSTLRARLAERLKDAGAVRVVEMVAASGQGVDRLLPAVVRAHECWSTRVGAGQLNRWLKQDIAARFAGSGVGGIASDISRIKYIAQIGACPPTFVCFATGTRPVAESVHAFLGAQLRAAFGLDATPLRFLFRYRPPRRQAGRRRVRLRRPALPPSRPGRRDDAAGLPARPPSVYRVLQQRAEAAAAERWGLRAPPDHIGPKHDDSGDGSDEDYDAPRPRARRSDRKRRRSHGRA